MANPEFERAHQDVFDRYEQRQERKRRMQEQIVHRRSEKTPSEVLNEFALSAADLIAGSKVEPHFRATCRDGEIIQGWNIHTYDRGERSVGDIEGTGREIYRRFRDITYHYLVPGMGLLMSRNFLSGTINAKGDREDFLTQNNLELPTFRSYAFYSWNSPIFYESTYAPTDLARVPALEEAIVDFLQQKEIV